MFPFKKYIIDLAGLFILLVLLIIFVVPWPTPDVSAQTAPEPVLKMMTLETETTTQEAQAGEVARLFGYRPVSSGPVPSSAMRPAVAALQTVSWLKYTGSITRENNIAYLYFKNSNTGRMMELNPDGSPNRDNWFVVEISSGFYILSDGKTKYKVMK